LPNPFNASRENLVVIQPATVDEAVESLMNAWQRGTTTAIVDLPDQSGPMRGHIVVSTRRLDRIVRLDRENSALVVEAGVTVQRIREAAGSVGLWCPALRWLPGETTIGAAVAGGHGRRGRYYGAVVDYVLGMRFVCPGVGLVRHGGMAIKNATGYNLTATVAGSHGSLGVILEVVVRLVPRPGHRVVQRLGFPRCALAWTAVDHLSSASLGAAAVEAFADVSGERAWILLECEDSHEGVVNQRLSELNRRATALGGVAEDDVTWPPKSQRTAFVKRAAIDPARFAQTCAALTDGMRRRGVSAYLLGEATGGALEVVVPATSLAILDELLEVVGIPGRAPSARDLWNLLKSAFDPNNLCLPR
jgi:FAD/FMN-containing dehydrogenase